MKEVDIRPFGEAKVGRIFETAKSFAKQSPATPISPHASLSPRVQRSGIEGSRQSTAHTVLKPQDIPIWGRTGAKRRAVRSHPRRRTAGVKRRCHPEWSKAESRDLDGRFSGSLCGARGWMFSIVEMFRLRASPFAQHDIFVIPSEAEGEVEESQRSSAHTIRQPQDIPSRIEPASYAGVTPSEAEGSRRSYQREPVRTTKGLSCGESYTIYS